MARRSTVWVVDVHRRQVLYLLLGDAQLDAVVVDRGHRPRTEPGRRLRQRLRSTLARVRRPGMLRLERQVRVGGVGYASTSTTLDPSAAVVPHDLHMLSALFSDGLGCLW
jgi:hypothetical protein